MTVGAVEQAELNLTVKRKIFVVLTISRGETVDVFGTIKK